MRSGDLKTIVTIYRKTEITSEYGEKSFVYNKYKVTRGNVNKLPRNRADIDSKATYMVDLSITIWAHVDINEDDVVKVNGNRYFINKINDDLDRNFKTVDLIDIDDSTITITDEPHREKYTILVTQNQSYMGYTNGSTMDYEDTEVEISATAFDGYIFDHWDDGNTDNPRTVIIKNNATYEAIFEAEEPDPRPIYQKVIDKMKEEKPLLFDKLTALYSSKWQEITNDDLFDAYISGEDFILKDLTGNGYDLHLSGMMGSEGDGCVDDNGNLVFDGIDDRVTNYPSFSIKDYTVFCDIEILNNANLYPTAFSTGNGNSDHNGFLIRKSSDYQLICSIGSRRRQNLFGAGLTSIMNQHLNVKAKPLGMSINNIIYTGTSLEDETRPLMIYFHYSAGLSTRQSYYILFNASTTADEDDWINKNLLNLL